MSKFDLFFFLLAWVCGVMLALSTMLEPVRKRLPKAVTEDRR